ncbi:MAG TPA: hypothetical protein VMV35_00300 [Halothiobacillus sp.]|nr:hypothetical protein [Halothiobacillus sp.]
MSTTKKAAKSTNAKAAPARRTVQVPATPETTPEMARKDIQRVMQAPELRAATVLSASESSDLMREMFDMPDQIALLREQAKAVQSGDLSRVEAMLINQATALEGLFCNLTQKAMNQSHMPNLEGFMRLALRAQSQCRATLETLATIKAPPVVFAKQANIAQGHQQVNNGTAPTPARKNESAPNELLEAKPYEPMDTRAPSQTSGHDSTMETVETINGASHTGR